jgi:hypothetical protein
MQEIAFESLVENNSISEKIVQEIHQRLNDPTTRMKEYLDKIITKNPDHPITIWL